MGAIASTTHVHGKLCRRTLEVRKKKKLLLCQRTGILSGALGKFTNMFCKLAFKKQAKHVFVCEVKQYRFLGALRGKLANIFVSLQTKKQQDSVLCFCKV